MAEPSVSAPPLHIAIDGRELVGRPTGVGRYLFEILRVWAADPTLPHRYTIVVPSTPPASLQALGDRLRWVVETTSSPGTRWEQTNLARRVRQAEPDVFFAAGYTAPLRLNVPMVAAIYDVSFFAHPEWFGRREGWRRRWLTRSAGRRAHSIVTISEFSALEIVRWLGVPREKIRLAPPGAPAAGPMTDGRREPIVLYVGSFFNRRRIPELIRAFAAGSSGVPQAQLILVGDNRTMPRIDTAAVASSAGVHDRVTWREYVSDDELAQLYQRARVFAFLSDYEGFGMTPLEAIAHGVPAVVLDTPVAREVYADGARLVPPDVTTIGRELASLLTDEAAHARLLAAGRRRLADFSWSRSAAVVLRALEEAARSR